MQKKGQGVSSKQKRWERRKQINHKQMSLARSTKAPGCTAARAEAAGKIEARWL